MAKLTDAHHEPHTGTKEWGITKMPQVGAGKKAYILNGAFDGACIGLMTEAGFERAATVEEADVIVFVGGADVNPEHYGQETLPGTCCNKARDITELAVFREAVALGKVMFGICRGAQLLHVANKGELWQDVNNHAGRSHYIYDIDEDVRLMVTSLHHQMLMVNDRIDVIAVCEDQIATKFKNADLFIDLEKEGANAPVEIEIEAGAYHETKCFFVQGHPEVGTPEYRSWTMTKLGELMQEWNATPAVKTPVDAVPVAMERNAE
jgi:GMP synthase-like glutamine amidotransferase